MGRAALACFPAAFLWAVLLPADLAASTGSGIVREIFRRYLEAGSGWVLMEDLNRRRDVRSKLRAARNGLKSGGNSFFRGALCALLSNPIYIGEFRHKGVRHSGLHEPIVERELWYKTQLLLRSQAVGASSAT
jgi:site-specific DNA recombinase